MSDFELEGNTHVEELGEKIAELDREIAEAVEFLKRSAELLGDHSPEWNLKADIVAFLARNKPEGTR